jgi:hypothetical protein
MAKQLSPKEALRLLPSDYASVIAEEVPETRTAEDLAEDEAIRLQAKVEGVELITEGRTLARKVILRSRHEMATEDEKQGRMFGIADRVGLMPLAEFAYHASSGMDTGDMGAMAAIYEMLQDCIRPEEWPAFKRYAKQIKADVEDLMDCVQQTTELLTANPTQRESGYSHPSSKVSDSLTDNSSGQTAGLIPVADLGRLASSG